VRRLGVVRLGAVVPTAATISKALTVAMIEYVSAPTFAITRMAPSPRRSRTPKVA
jgi:hypothetical protein